MEIKFTWLNFDLDTKYSYWRRRMTLLNPRVAVYTVDGWRMCSLHRGIFWECVLVEWLKINQEFYFHHLVQLGVLDPTTCSSSCWEWVTVGNSWKSWFLSQGSFHTGTLKSLEINDWRDIWLSRSELFSGIVRHQIWRSSPPASGSTNGFLTWEMRWRIWWLRGISGGDM